ncbi:DUF3617 family protein [Methylocystis sp. ATCC 49242]|uniref:DUF3617 domain-containing protein n=1 Tax=Methylocystis sp. ATCC 49242 TaxID=622637 RepID=UPI0005613933|nr:DUF3617 family protein [Methylocystis sp. ATCC 49242]
MKSPSWIRVLIPVIALAGAALARDSAFADASSELPKRERGLWRITTVSPEVGMHTHNVCIAEGDSIIGNQAADCSQPSVKRAGDQVIVTIECGVGDRRNVESLLFTGDFKSWYRAQSKISSGGKRSGFSIDAKFLGGDCSP